MNAVMDVLGADFLTTAMQLNDLPAPMFAEVAFAGRSNVGKSSLINSMAQRKKLARTSSTPGCTRGLNLFRLTLRGDAHLDFVDLPGYGFAKRSKAERLSWGPMIETFLERRVGLRGVILLVDARRGLEDEEHELLDFLAHAGKKALLVATKVDLLPKSKKKARLLQLEKEARVRVIGYCATTGEGRDDLWRALCRLADISVPSSKKPVDAPRVDEAKAAQSKA
jgi:GTP-binding protein